LIVKPKRHQSKKLRESARGRDCQVRLPGCNHNPKTTALAHLNGGGMGTKHSDIHGAFACSNCHEILDTNANTDFDREFIELAHHQGVMRTQKIWLDEGLLSLP